MAIDKQHAHQLLDLRKARGPTQVQLAEATKTTQRSISYHENDDGVPPSSIVVVPAQALQVSADELLGLKQPSAVPAWSDDEPETRRLWKRFQVVTQLPAKDQRAAIRLISSLAAAGPVRKNGAPGERHGR